MSPIKLLIIDDELDFRESIALYLQDAGFVVLEASNGREGLDLFDHDRPDIVFTDLHMPVMDGFEFIAELAGKSPATPIIVISGIGHVKEVTRAMRLGARDYLVKPILDMDDLKLVIMKAFRENSLIKEIDSLKDKLLSGDLRHQEAFSLIKTQNQDMIALMKYLEAIAITSEPVLITGETGTGKELLAEAVHKVSERKGDFIAVNISGLDDQMFSDTLFGHVKGAFSSAEHHREGLLAQAAGGSIFLDEIGDLHETSQVKLLRLLQERKYYQLGADIPKKTDARIIAATNRDLRQMVNSGTFRADLYYRLFTHQITIPPLRDRKGDIPLLLDCFIHEAANTLGKKPPTYPPELLSYLAAYDFPGNVRELMAMVFDAVARHTHGVLAIDSFRKAIGFEISTKTAINDMAKCTIMLHNGDVERMPTLDEAETVLIGQAMDLANGNQGVAATLLGISRNALNKKINRRKARSHMV
ncbi:sigma-54-dependent transcriptional regulator [Geobacter anodireducens]|uniref:Sigma-54-dependent Fis family transcriptional regulator n=1 Tax=Geobacter anodireducens TaxID=1340425 RepID=A0ABR9NW24_9BACT|nr:sigma-54 dependent transcriptional regulator [Geobacter anodireducens]MBE2888467.1 sigma-54-dependent Fis family transcriptional regulator [Geobacter anodireducens]